MEIVYSQGAQEDIRKSIQYYEDEVEGLGKDFWEVVEQSAEKIFSFPLASQFIREPYRRFLLKRFPYGIIYRIDNDCIFVAVVMHLKREPYFWLNDPYYTKQ